MRSPKRYLTIKQAAAYLDVVPNTLRNWGATGKIQERRHPISNYRLYKKSELDQLVKLIDRSIGRPKKPR